MELRVLQYFLAIAQTETISRAAEVLHVTQPTLSRQMAQMERELGVQLFLRGRKKITLTAEGLLLRSRAEEILELVDKTETDLVQSKKLLGGTVAIGCGDLAAVQQLPALCRSFHETYPAVRFDLHTGTADQIEDRLDRGLADVGLLLEPVNVAKYAFIRLRQKEQWVAAMRPDSPLARLEAVTPEDLKDVPLILPQRLNVQSELAHWFGVCILGCTCSSRRICRRTARSWSGRDWPARSSSEARSLSGMRRRSPAGRSGLRCVRPACWPGGACSP